MLIGLIFWGSSLGLLSRETVATVREERANTQKHWESGCDLGTRETLLHHSCRLQEEAWLGLLYLGFAFPLQIPVHLLPHRRVMAVLKRNRACFL